MRDATSALGACWPQGGTCSRRELMQRVAAAGATVLLAACGGGDAMAPAADDSFSVVGDTIVLRLDRVPALQVPDSFHVVAAQNVVVLRLGADEYRAFTNICTHAGCGIFVFQSQRLRCLCHQSEFDVNGTNVAGPAPLPLQRYAVTVDVVARELRILKR